MNITTTCVHIETLNRIEKLESGSIVATSGNADLFLNENPIEIKVGDNKVKVTTLEFMQAFKDMLDTGTFELDQIDSAVWSIESKLEEAQDKLTSTMDFIQSKGWC